MNDSVLLGTGQPPEDDRYRQVGLDGMQQDYLVLSEAERAKGFVRPVHRSYLHDRCGTETTMNLAIAETYARSPEFYSGTYCVRCGGHFPVGSGGEFTWPDGSKVGT